MEYDKERLIDVVHSKPALWDKRSFQYQNRNIKNKEWQDLNKILEYVEENEAKEKWENTRDIFRREFNKSIKSSGQGTDEVYKSKWPYYEQMLFLKDVMMPRKTSSNIPKISSRNNEINFVDEITVEHDNQNPDDQIEIQSETLETSNIEKSITPSPVNKRKTFKDEALEIERKKIKLFEARLEARQQKNLNKNKETDGDYHFLMSILPMFKKMNEADNLEAKMEIYSVLKKYVNRTSFQSHANSNDYYTSPSSSYYQTPSPVSLDWATSGSRTSTYIDMDAMSDQQFKKN